MILFIDSKPGHADAEVFSNGITIRGRIFYYYELHRYLFGEILLINIHSTGYLEPLIPSFTDVNIDEAVENKMTELNRRIEQVNRILTAMKSMKDEKKRNLLLDELEQLLPYIPIPTVRSNSTNIIDIYNLPVIIDGVQVTAGIDTFTEINLVKNIPKNAHKTGSVRMGTANAYSNSDVYTIPIEIDGKSSSIEAALGYIPKDILLTPDTAELFGIVVEGRKEEKS
jgi:hypothetical protein